MSEIIYVHFPDISGEVTTNYRVFVRGEDGLRLNPAGDTIAESGTSKRFIFTLGDDSERVPGQNYHVRIYSTTSETTANLIYDDILYAGQNIVGRQFPSVNLTTIRCTVGTTNLTTSSLKVSASYPSGSSINQWNGRIIVFDNDTTTAALRGQATDILSCSAEALPILTFTPLTAAPVAGDKFTIV